MYSGNARGYVHARVRPRFGVEGGGDSCGRNGETDARYVPCCDGYSLPSGENNLYEYREFLETIFGVASVQSLLYFS